MLMIEDAEDRTVPLLPKLMPPMRLALVSDLKFVFCIIFKVYIDFNMLFIYLYNVIVSVCEQKSVFFGQYLKTRALYGQSKHRFGIITSQLTVLIHFHASFCETNSEFFVPS